MLYVFQAVSPPIIRSSKLYTQHLVYVKLGFELLMMGEELPETCRALTVIKNIV
jgi:hypothetical protein